MKELELKYGCNPNQKPSRIYMSDGRELPIKVLCGRPGSQQYLPTVFCKRICSGKQYL